MKIYNRSLDMLTLALQQAKQGNAVVAAKLLVKASTAPDTDKALAILEASNAQAYELQAKAVIVAKAVVAKPKSGAAARLKASAEVMAEEEKKEEDEDEDLSDLIDDLAEDKDEAELEEYEEDEEDEDMGEAIASVLAAMLKTKAKIKVKK